MPLALSTGLLGTVEAKDWPLTAPTDDCPDGLCSIQIAINDERVVDGDVLVLADGVYTGGGNTEIVMADKRLTIRSASGDPTACTIDLENQEGAWGIRYPSGTDYTGSRVEGIGIHNAGNGNEAGAILMDGSGELVLEGCRFEGNASLAAVRTFSASNIVLTGCEFSENTGSYAVYATAVEATDCIVAGNQSGFFVYGNSTFTDCRFESNQSAGLHMDGGVANVTLRRCDFIDNGRQGVYGENVFHLPDAGFGPIQIDDCHFSGNGLSAVQFEAASNMEVSVTGCTFDSNRSTSVGAAVRLLDNTESSSGTVSGCSFSSNVCDGDGGAIWSTGVDLTVENGCEFRGNTADRGGAIYVQRASLDLLDALVAENVATLEGGGIYVWLTDAVTVEGVTIANNDASGNPGGGLYVGDFASNVAIRTSIVAFNRGTSGVGVSSCSAMLPPQCVDIYGNGGEDWGADCLLQFQNVSGNLRRNPLFCDADGGIYTLCVDSPCLASNHAECDVDMGRGSLGCEVCPVIGETRSWSALKTQYTDPD
jgi:predicted outer membrane repeat protein